MAWLVGRPETRSWPVAWRRRFDATSQGVRFGDEPALETGLVVKSPLVRSSTLVVSGLTVVLIVFGLWLAVLNRNVAADAPVPEPVGAFVWVQLISAIVWSVAAVILLRRPEIGWSILCALTGLSHAGAAVGYGWAVCVFVEGTATSGGDVAVWLTVAMLPFEVLALNWMAMTLPDGLLPTGGGVGSRLRPPSSP